MIDTYRHQVALLLSVLPEVAKEKCFALHGGTAINLFVFDMPRLSVDIDLTFVDFISREEALTEIAKGLLSVKDRIERVLPGIKVEHKRDICKLLVSSGKAVVKVEVNSVNRGLLQPAVFKTLCKKAQDEYRAFIEVPMVSLPQLYGGKICAALIRQHPRDLFDVKGLIESNAITREVFVGFLHALLSNERPMDEILAPHFLDQRHAMKQQFEGMSSLPFSYETYEHTREELLEIVRQMMTDNDKRFLLSISKLDPEWTHLEFSRFPAVQWKLINLEKLKNSNMQKFKKQYQKLSNAF